MVHGAHQARDRRHLSDGGNSCAPLNTTADLVGDPQLAAARLLYRIDHPVAGKFKYPGAPFRMTQTPFAIRRPAPMLGQHNAEVLGELGYDSNDLAVLSATGVIIDLWERSMPGLPLEGLRNSRFGYSLGGALRHDAVGRPWRPGDPGRVHPDLSPSDPRSAGPALQGSHQNDGADCGRLSQPRPG